MSLWKSLWTHQIFQHRVAREIPSEFLFSVIFYSIILPIFWVYPHRWLEISLLNVKGKYFQDKLVGRWFLSLKTKIQGLFLLFVVKKKTLSIKISLYIQLLIFLFSYQGPRCFNSNIKNRRIYLKVILWRKLVKASFSPLLPNFQKVCKVSSTPGLTLWVIGTFVSKTNSKGEVLSKILR